MFKAQTNANHSAYRMHPSKRAQIRLHLGLRLGENARSADRAFALNVTNYSAYLTFSFRFTKHVTPMIRALADRAFAPNVSNDTGNFHFLYFFQTHDINKTRLWILFRINELKNNCLTCLIHVHGIISFHPIKLSK